MRCCILSLFISLISLGLLARATIIYVDQSTQSNRPDGSQTSPYPTLATALATGGASIDIIFLGDSYTISTKEVYKTSKRDSVAITLSAPGQFTLKFTENGQISCTNFQQSLNEKPVKNVNITFTGFAIETQSTLPLFHGDCYFTLQDISINELFSPLLIMKNEGSALLRNLTIASIVLEPYQNLIDQDSRQRLEADYLVFDSVVMRNLNTDSDALVRSFLQYKLIDIKDSVLEGISFNIKGEQTLGNAKTDIKVRNVTMSNANNFFFIESYGTCLIQDSVFRNSTNHAFHFFLGDENLSPVEIQITNSVFEDNSVKYAGGAVTFQGSYQTSYQFSLKATISNCRFSRNKASFSGGALAFLFFKNTDVEVSDCQFTGNSAVEAGGVVYVNKGESGMNFAFRNNRFEDNTAFTGGVFSFEFLNGPRIELQNNQYTGNSADLEGGVGYVTESAVALKDSNSVVSENKADFQGGAWSLESKSDIVFDNVDFENNQAYLKGGCIVNSGASLTLNEDTFERCELTSITSLGGAIYTGEAGTTTVKGSMFSNNVAEYGASVAIESSRGAPQVIDGSTITTDMDQCDNGLAVKSQVHLGDGELVLEESKVPSLETPFYTQRGGSAEIRKASLGNIQCLNEQISGGSCILGLDRGNEENELNLEVEGLSVGQVDSRVPLFFSEGATVLLESVEIGKVGLGEGIPLGEFRDSNWKTDDVELPGGNVSFIRMVNSELSVVNSNWEYHGRQGNSNEYDVIVRNSI